MIVAVLAQASLAATLTVNTTADANNPNDGVLDFREALATAAVGDTIAFDETVFPPGVGPTAIVVLLGPFDVTTDDLIIAGDERVALDGTLSASGDAALRIEAEATRVTGLRIEEFFTIGILIEGGAGHFIGEAVPGGAVEIVDTDGAGIWVGDPTKYVQAVTITATTVGGACANAVGPCAGIMIRGTGHVDGVTVADSEVVDTQAVAGPNQGSGIMITVGSGHLIDNTTIGIGGGNRAHGIAITGTMAPITATVQGSIIGENVGHGIHLGPGSEACEVEGNVIGLTSLGDPAGNDQNGVSIFGSDGHAIRNNVISANGMSGIRMAGASGGNWQSDHTIQGNWIGTTLDGTAALGNLEHGILSQGGEGDSLIGGTTEGEGNIVSGNAKHGIRLDDGQHDVFGNRIGTDVSGTVAVANGYDGTGAWAGLFVDGPLVDIGTDGQRYVFLPELSGMNQVSGNVGDGIRLKGAPQSLVRGNLVGTGADGDAPLGNGGHGIVVLGPQILFYVGGETPSGRNIVLDNGGDGIRLESVNNAFDGFLVGHNMVGRGLHGTVAGNGGDGIALLATTFPIANGTVTSNFVQGNGGVGLHLSGATEIELLGNLLDENVECGMLLENGANPAAVPATVVDYNAYSVNGSFAAGTAVDLIEIYWDDEEGEASRLLGEAEFDTVAGTFWLTIANPTEEQPFPTNGRVSALLTVNGETSGLDAWCEDGCAAGGAGSCNDGEACTTDTCTAGVGCSYAAAPNTTECNDGNACTFSPMAAEDRCDGAGRCQGSSLVSACGGADWCQDDTFIRDCSDGDLCGTADRCDPDTGQCQHVATSLTCPDQNKCTADECDPDHGCVYTPRNADFFCDHDQSMCTEYATCNAAGECVAADDLTVTCPSDCGTPSVCNPTSGCEPQVDCTITDGYCSGVEMCKCIKATEDCAGFGDPASALYDSDLDGIPDNWEQFGLDTDCDGTNDFFPEPGDPTIPTVWLEIDFMVTDDHSHEPKEGVADALIEAFQQGGGASGLRPWELLVDVSSAVPHYDSISMNGQGPDKPEPCDNWILLQDLKKEYSDPGRRTLYHYVVMGHRIGTCDGGTTGSSPVPGQNFMVALGIQPDEQGLPVGPFSEQVGTLMHELGHNLGLRHSGYSDSPDSSIIYQSVMSYAYEPSLFEWPSVDIRRYDYSREDRSFDEAFLDEVVGFNTANSEEFWYEVDKECPGAQAPVGPLNWNCNVDTAGVGIIDTGLVAAQLDEKPGLTQLRGREDWWTLDPYFQCGAGESAYTLSTWPDGHGELTLEERIARGHFDGPIRAVVDPMPSCADDPLPEDGTGRIQLLVYGSPTFDVTDLDLMTVRLSGARLGDHRLLDFDQDEEEDIVLEVDVADMATYTPIAAVLLSASTEAGTGVIGGRPMFNVPTAEDGDADGVPDPCDLCPQQAAAAASPDGCP